MTAAELNPEQTAVLTQEELLDLLPEGLEPDAYLVIPIGMLSRQAKIDWYAVAREHRGEVRGEWFAYRHIRSLAQLGHVVNTKYPKAKP